MGFPGDDVVGLQGCGELEECGLVEIDDGLGERMYVGREVLLRKTIGLPPWVAVISRFESV